MKAAKGKNETKTRRKVLFIKSIKNITFYLVKNKKCSFKYFLIYLKMAKYMVSFYQCVINFQEYHEEKKIRIYI